MSENNKDAMYPPGLHPHSGDARVDPKAKRNRAPLQNKNQGTLDSLIQPAEVTPRRTLQKPTFYTVKAGVDYSFAPRGSEQGSELAGRFEAPTRIKVIGKRVVNGEASVYAEFVENGEVKRHWVAIDDFRNKKK